MTKEPLVSSASSLEIFGIWKSGRVVMGSSSICRFRGLALLGVELDDQLFLNRRCDLGALRKPQDLRGERVVVGLKPRRHRGGELGCRAHDVGGGGLGLD